MLDAGGGFQSDLTALRLGQNEYLLYVGTASIKRDLAWLRRSLATGERVELTDVTELYAVLALAGPKVADIVTALDAGDLTALAYFQHAQAEIAGQATSAAFGHRIGKPVALAYLASEHVGDAHNTRVELDIAGERFAGLASTQAAFDPKGLRMRH